MIATPPKKFFFGGLLYLQKEIECGILILIYEDF